MRPLSAEPGGSAEPACALAAWCGSALPWHSADRCACDPLANPRAAAARGGAGSRSGPWPRLGQAVASAVRFAGHFSSPSAAMPCPGSGRPPAASAWRSPLRAASAGGSQPSPSRPIASSTARTSARSRRACGRSRPPPCRSPLASGQWQAARPWGVSASWRHPLLGVHKCPKTCAPVGPGSGVKISTVNSKEGAGPCRQHWCCHIILRNQAPRHCHRVKTLRSEDVIKGLHLQPLSRC